eukprot:m.35472 g.35472  ORF g.35472 m.35472 type:complete len:218 (+) comp11147_c0_seq2:45-698(+)
MALKDHDVVRLSGEYDLPSVTSVQLDHMDLVSIGCLSKCSRLSFISLCSNGVHDLKPLSSLVDLATIIANNNRISSLKDISSLPKLKDLRVAGNPLPDFEVLMDELKPLQSLERLDIATADQPFQGEIDFHLLQSIFPKLKVFNGKLLAFHELVQAPPSAQLPSLKGPDLPEIQHLFQPDVMKQREDALQASMTELRSMMDSLRQELLSPVDSAGTK